jgi:aspartyl/asparaginyl beta-hydroxylase (cupin superfamily)
MDGRKWRTVFFNSQGRLFASNCASFPTTSAAIASVPRVFQAFLSRLDAGKSIPCHSSPYHGYLRYHLALQVPKGDAPYLVVGGVRLDWKEGEGFLFDDTFPHYVLNESSTSRTILIVDIERPMRGLGTYLARVMNLILYHTHAKRVQKNAATSGWLTN